MKSEYFLCTNAVLDKYYETLSGFKDSQEI